jgi:hypothetical protein
MKKILLLVIASFAINLNAQIVDCAELFISEYVEGPGNNNAIEIYNPTNAAIDLTDYAIKRYGNGDNNPANADVWQLSGNINSGEAIAIGNGQLDSLWVTSGSYWSTPVDPIFYAACNLHGSGIYPTPFYFNGDDAMTLEKNNIPVDIFGKVGEDPGGAWTDDATANPPFTDGNGGTWWTKRQTLVRKASVKQGVTMNPTAFNPTLEYDSLPDATYSGMGSHTCDCHTTNSIDENAISYVMYPNPANIGNTVTINANAKIESIVVVSILGEKVLTQISNKIITTNLARGTYIINIQFTDGRIIDNKLIIE